MKARHRAYSLLICFVSALFLGGAAFAQEKDWRPVSPDDLASKKPLVEPDADAEAIFWEIRIDDSGSDSLTLKHYVRVKIYNERGREKYSKFDVPFSKGMKIKDLAARVTKPDGTTVEIKKEDVFEREIVKTSGVKIKAKSFAIPNIEPGVIIEYKYKEVISDAGASGMRLPFQRDIPIQKLAYYYKPYNKNEPEYVSYNFTDTKFVKDKDGYWLASRTDAPALKSEPLMPPEDNVQAWMLLTHSRLGWVWTSDSTYTITIKDQRIPTLYWQAVGTEKSASIQFMFKENKDIQKTVANVTAGAASAEDKLKKIYEFCQNQIANTTFDPTITDEQREKLPKIKEFKDVLKQKAAAAVWIDFLFGAMTNASGFETRVAFTGDRSKMFISPDMTNENLLHRAAIAVKVDNAWKYFKPGFKFLPYGVVPWSEEDWGLLVGEKKYEWKKAPTTSYSSSVTKRTGKFSLLEDGTLEGTVQIELNGQLALLYRWDNYDETPAKLEENLIEDVKRRISVAEVSNVAIENLSDNTKPLIKKYTIRVPSYAQKTGKRLFLQPGFFEYGRNPVFSSSTRTYDIFFQYPWSEEDHIEIAYPKNFDLDNADAPGSVADPKKIGLLDIKIAVSRPTNRISYDRHFHFGGDGFTWFGSNMYTPLKALFDAFHTADSHSLTLKQK